MICCATFLLSCSTKEEYIPWHECSVLNDSFKKVIKLDTHAEDVKTILHISDWVIDDSLLVCSSEGTDLHFYRLNLSNWSLCDSLGSRGVGPTDLLYPHLAIKSFGQYWVMDNAKLGSSFLLSSDSLIKLNTHAPQWLVNHPKFVQYPLLGSIEYLRGKVMWKLLNVETGVLCDTLSIADGGNPEESIDALEMYWDKSGRHVALVFRFKEQFVIGYREVNGRIFWHSFANNTTSQTEKVYYSDIACDEDCIYLLSPKYNGIEGNSSIEVFDYDGNPLCRYELDMNAQWLLFDKARNRFLLRTILDDYIHVAELPSD